MVFFSFFFVLIRLGWGFTARKASSPRQSRAEARNELTPFR
jgi:hypothetical protein